ncbi:hypothetical protein FACS1894156_4360 [Bacteroidia bacterium]|nr:hypothetical protein FACS1894156_4360 [Bacteroidia bacterium]
MNKIFSCSKIVAVCLLLVASLAPAFGRQKVAVYVTGNNNAPENKIIASKLVSAITTDGYYEAVERTAAFLAQIQKEQKYQQGGAVADDQLSKLGQQMGVDFVCIAEVVPVGRAFFISARLVNVETAGVETTADATCESTRDINAIVASANELAAKLVNPDGHVAPKPKAAPAPITKAPKASQQGWDDEEDNSRSSRNKNNAQKVYVSDVTGCNCEIMAGDLPGKQSFNNVDCPKGWRLPTRRELSCMCEKAKKIGGFNIGSTPYWSGESVNDKKAYAITFNDCESEKENKSKEIYVRCVRD